ncbi:MAG: hypothetical protein M5U26_30135 [Planctomycetota bacterium]|nr:hypothetical protein [Planctomycetota bacterium]
MKNSRLAGLLLLCVSFSAAAEDAWEVLNSETGLPGDEVQFIKKAQGGGAWIGTLAGLARWKDGKVETVLPKLQAWDVYELSPEEAWVGTNAGAIRLKGGPQEPLLKGQNVAPLLRYDEKTVWALCKDRNEGAGRVVACAGETWEPVEAFKDLPVLYLSATSDGRLWVAVEADGVYSVEPGKGPSGIVHHLKGRPVTCIAQDGQQRVWAGTWGAGVYVLEGDAWMRHLEKEKASINTIVADTAGALWVATSAHGLWRYDGQAWTNDLKDEGAINLLAATSDGKVWVSSQTQGGLRFWDGKAWQVSLASPFPIRCIYETPEKGVWAGGILDGVHMRK